MTIRRCVTATALGAAILSVASAQAPTTASAQVQPGMPQQSEYCIKAADLYQKIIGGPMQGERKSPTSLLTYSIYRNMAASRIVTLAWAGKCDMTPFLRMEINHQHDASDQVTPMREDGR